MNGVLMFFNCMCRLETLTTPINPNEYLYQCKEYDEEFGVNMYDFHARMYDAALGCWHVPDPMHQYASGYMAMGDNPVSVVDPSGMWTGDVWDWIRGLFDRAQNGAQLRYGKDNISYQRGWDYANRWNFAGDGSNEWNVEMFMPNSFSIWGGGGGSSGGGSGGSPTGGGVGGSHTAYVAPHDISPDYTGPNRGHGTNEFNSEMFVPQFAPSPWDNIANNSSAISASSSPPEYDEPSLIRFCGVLTNSYLKYDRINKLIAPNIDLAYYSGYFTVNSCFIEGVQQWYVQAYIGVWSPPIGSYCTFDANLRVFQGNSEIGFSHFSTSLRPKRDAITPASGNGWEYIELGWALCGLPSETGFDILIKLGIISGNNINFITIGPYGY